MSKHIAFAYIHEFVDFTTEDEALEYIKEVRKKGGYVVPHNGRECIAFLGEEYAYPYSVEVNLKYKNYNGGW